jgi:hypothetical protein
MTIIEIRRNKKTLIPMLAFLTAALLGMTYYIYFSGKFDNNNTMKIVYIFLTALMIYAIYIPAKKFFENPPVLTFSKDELEINEKGKPVSFLWLQIIDWKIEKDEDGPTYYLTIETAIVKRKINISWLDKRPTEIEQLLHMFKKK